MRDKLLKDIVAAMKSQDKETLNTLRLLKGAMQLEEINKKTELNDEEMISLISKQIKTRKESIVEFKKGNRIDLIEKTKKEIAILEKYLPEQLEEAEVDKIIEEAFNEIKPTEMRDMGKLMGLLNPKLKGRTDMGAVSSKIKNKLNEIINK